METTYDDLYMRITTGEHGPHRAIRQTLPTLELSEFDLPSSRLEGGIPVEVAPLSEVPGVGAASAARPSSNRPDVLSSHMTHLLTHLRDIEDYTIFS